MKLTSKILVTFSVLAVFAINVPCSATILYSENFEGLAGPVAMDTIGWTYGIAGASGTAGDVGRNGTKISYGGQFMSHSMDAAPTGNEILSISGEIEVYFSHAGENHAAIGINDHNANLPVAEGGAAWFGGTPDVYPGIGAMLWRSTSSETKLVIWRPLTLGGGYAEAVINPALILDPGGIGAAAGNVAVVLNTATGLADGYFQGVKLISNFDMTGTLTAAQFSTAVQGYTHYLGKWRSAVQMDNFLVESVPEPATMALMVAGLIGLRRRKR